MASVVSAQPGRHSLSHTEQLLTGTAMHIDLSYAVKIKPPGDHLSTPTERL